jgi:YggT family protein
VELVCTLLWVYILLILVRLVLSWFPIAPGTLMASVASFLYAITEPVLGPLRRAIPPVRLGAMGLDLSPIIVIIGLQLLAGFIC